MQNVITKIFWVIGYSIIGSFIGLLLGIGILILQGSDAFVSWKLLDNSFKFTHIDPIISNESDIIATSQEGKTYLRDCDRETGCSWSKTEEVFQVVIDDWNKKGSTCQLSEWSTPKDPPGKVVECVFTSWAAGEGVGVDYYVLLDDGKVWHWSQSSDALGSLYFIFISAMAGAVLGLLAGISVLIIKKKRLFNSLKL